MKDFQSDISNRIVKLRQSNELATKKTQFSRIYSMALVDADWNEITKIDDFQTAFLDLLNENHSSLAKEFQKSLDERFIEMYNSSADEVERNYKQKDELTLHKIQVPSEITDDWQLMYEMNSDETIFHVEFEGWTYKSVGVTH